MAKMVIDDVNYPDLCVIKSRQLGFSEVGIEQMIYWLDIHSADKT
jgi:hypothetical protein